MTTLIQEEFEEKATARPATRTVTPDISVWSRIARMWEDRHLLVFMVSRDVKVKYKNSVLGLFWSLLNPALMVVVYVLIFQIALKAGIPDFAIFLMCGLVFWNFFSTAVSGACGSVVGNAHLIKKVSFSREILPMAAIGTSSVFWLFQLVILIGALAVFRFPPQSPYVFLIPLALVALVVFTAALSVFLSAVTVYYRDIQHLLEVALFAWFWANPIVYSWGLNIRSGLAKHGLTWLYLLNPIAPIILLFQRALYGDRLSAQGAPTGKLPASQAGHHIVALFPPHWYAEVFGVIIVVSFVLFLLALKLFGRLEGNFAEEL